MIKEQGLWPLLMKKLKWLYAFTITSVRGYSSSRSYLTNLTLNSIIHFQEVASKRPTRSCHDASLNIACQGLLTKPEPTGSLPLAGTSFVHTRYSKHQLWF